MELLALFSRNPRAVPDRGSDGMVCCVTTIPSPIDVEEQRKRKEEMDEELPNYLCCSQIPLLCLIDLTWWTETTLLATPG